MPDAEASRKRQIPVRRIPCDLGGLCGDHATKSHNRETSVRTADLRWAGGDVRCRDQDLKRNRMAASLYILPADWRGESEPGSAAGTSALLWGWMISVGMDDSFEHSIRRKPFA